MWVSLARRQRLLHILLVICGLGGILVAIGTALVGVGSQHGVGLKSIILAVVGLTFLLKGVDLMRTADRLGWEEVSKLSLSGKWIKLAGIVNVACFGTYAAISYGLFPRVWARTAIGGMGWFEDYFRGLGQIFAILGTGAQSFVTGQAGFTGPEIWLIAYCLPQVVSTGVFLTLLVLLARHRESLVTNLPRILFTWAIVFAAITVFASPVLVQDFWHPLGWGRMVVAGVNPYYVGLGEPFTAGLATAGHEKMMYGPLVAILSGALMWSVNGNALLGALAFKLVFATGWVGSLWLVWSLLRPKPVWHQCVGILVFGWMPLNLIQSVGDGHTDTLMVFFLLLWLYSLERGRAVVGSISLALSVLAKYVSAPLFLLDLMYLLFARRRRIWDYWPQLSAVTLLTIGMLAIFYRSPDFFASTFSRTDWHFFSLREGVIALELYLSVSIPHSVEIVRLIFPALALYCLVSYSSYPNPDRFRKTVLAVISAILFGYIAGLWPWYYLWVVPLAALVPGSMLGRWAIGAALLAPFLMLIWLTFPVVDPYYIFDLPTLIFFGVVILWSAFVPARWFPEIGEPGLSALFEFIRSSTKKFLARVPQIRASPRG